MSAPTPSPRLHTAQAFIGAFATLDPSTFANTLSEKFTHKYAPTSLAKALSREGHPSKEAFLEHIRGVGRLMTGFPVTALQYIEDENQNAVWCWARSRTEWRVEVKDEQEEWGYEGEYVFMFWMDEEGKIERCVEMLDSWATREKLLQLSAKARENIKNRTGEEFDWINKK